MKKLKSEDETTSKKKVNTLQTRSNKKLSINQNKNSPISKSIVVPKESIKSKYGFTKMESQMLEDESAPKLVDPIDCKNDAMKFMKIVMYSPAKVKFGLANTQPKKLTEISRVILHYHGGGFVCMNTDSHQRYLRCLKNSTNSQEILQRLKRHCVFGGLPPGAWV